MQIIKYKAQAGQKLCGGGKKRVMALGFFDGVHAAHRKLLSAAKEISLAEKMTFSVFTFSSENMPKKQSGILYSTSDKLLLLEKFGVEEVIICDFSEIRSVLSEDFVNNTLLCDLNCGYAVVGYDFTYGRGAEGNAQSLSEALSLHGVPCHIVEEQMLGGEKISSSRIKAALGAGDVEGANRLLEYPYFTRAKIVHGYGLGAKLGIPTINFDLHSTPLKTGVYRTLCLIGEKYYDSITNIGRCPTVGVRQLHGETHIIGFSEDIYDSEVIIYYLGYIREEKKFASVTELTERIKLDKNIAIEENRKTKWQEIGLNLQ